MEKPVNEISGNPKKTFVKKKKNVECQACLSPYLIIQIKIWYDKNMPCPVCGSLFSPLTITERELHKAQKLYFSSNREEKYLHMMYEYTCSYATSLLLKYFSATVPTEDQRYYHAHNSTAYFLENYLYREDFKINVSFASYLITKIRYSVFGKHEKPAGQIKNKKGEEIAPVSLNFEDAEGKEFIEIKDNTLEKVEADIYTKNIKEFVLNLIFELSGYCTDQEDLMRLLGLKVYLTKGERAADRLFRIYDRNGKSMFLKTLEILRKELVKQSKR